MEKSKIYGKLQQVNVFYHACCAYTNPPRHLALILAVFEMAVFDAQNNTAIVNIAGRINQRYDFDTGMKDD